MTKVYTLAKVFHELLKNVPTEAGATLSRGQAETLAGLADIAAAVMAEARADDKERAAVLAEAGRADNGPVMLQDLRLLCEMMTDAENDIDIVNDHGAAYEYDVISTLYQQAKAAGYTDGQTITLWPANNQVTQTEIEAEARAQRAEAKAADIYARKAAAVIMLEEQGAITSLAEAQAIIDNVYRALTE